MVCVCVGVGVGAVGGVFWCGFGCGFRAGLLPCSFPCSVVFLFAFAFPPCFGPGFVGVVVRSGLVALLAPLLLATRAYCALGRTRISMRLSSCVLIACCRVDELLSCHATVCCHDVVGRALREAAAKTPWKTLQSCSPWWS